MAKKPKYYLATDAQKQNVIQIIRDLPTDLKHPLVVTISEMTRSVAQNDKMWAMLTDISKQVEWYSNWLEPEEWKHVITAALKGQKTVPGINGGFVVLGLSTSKMTIREMCDVIECAYAFGTEHDVKWKDETILADELAKRFGDSRSAA
ncbi:recombination protein NinB [Erwinia endophytica]|uniref:recombination protein NinB n=1 Tax=Erwinia endophytica TaxID=1563158 RepID=UPI001265F502|nr:recombination protein NinB [Erwinia endophytica]KAB8312954.1 recombination protein NinB [Erwinia endophytica]